MNDLPTSETPPVQSLGRVLDVLCLFVGDRRDLSLSEIAELLEWPVPTAHRAVGTLSARGFLERDPNTKRFRVGPELVRLAASRIAVLGLPELSRPHLQELTEATGETASLAMLDGREVLFLASSPGTFRLRVDASPGLRMAANCSALGKCLLAQLDPEDARRRLGPEPYPSGTTASARTWKKLASGLERARRDGYALSVGEYEVGMLSCAVPVSTDSGIAAAINVASTTARLTPEALVEVVLPKLRAAAASIAHDHGRG